LNTLATQVLDYAHSSSDPGRVHSLVAAIRDLARASR
jgi:hypothetical protein